MKVEIVQTEKELPVPTYAHKGDAGVDLYSSESCVLLPGDFRVIKTGLKVAVPYGYEAQVRPRSGLAAKFGISVLNAPGTIDHEYRGEIGVILINFGKADFKVMRGDRIAQMVFAKVEHAEFCVVDDLDKTKRGDGGFGSTGI